MTDYKRIIDFIRSEYNTEEFIPLHAPVFRGNEKNYLNECIDSTFVSSVGKFVDLFEEKTAEYTGARRAVAVVNGTSALHAALKLVGVNSGDEVVTQPLTFIATCNAISYCGAKPVFADVDIETMGLSHLSLQALLEDNYSRTEAGPVNKKTGNRLSACVPMHTFGFPLFIDELSEVCDDWNLPIVEDAAESLGSYVNGTHTGLFGRCGVLSFNGNKTITTGGGGMIITNDEELGRRAKHVTTTAKVPHKWEFNHDLVGFNYRMPNINAALGCAQLEQLSEILKSKRETAERYKSFFDSMGIGFVTERTDTIANYWLNVIRLNSKKERDEFLEHTNGNGVMTRPIWTLMNNLEMYADCLTTALPNAVALESTVVNIPSSCR